MDEFIIGWLRSKTPVTVYILNGFQVKGRIVAYGQDYIAVESGRLTKRIYKHAISTIEEQV